MKILFGILRLLWIPCLMIGLVSCEKDDDAATNAEATKAEKPILELPNHFPPPHYQFTRNPLSKEGVELGRQLFYDPGLSKDGRVSCGSCHAQVHAFADHNVPLSFGVFNRMGERNTPGLANLIWTPEFHWDGGVNHIEIQAIAPLTDSAEMGQDLNDIITYLQGEAFYRQSFKNAFGDENINTRRLLLALTQFMSTMISADAKYDQVVNGKASFSEKEGMGKQIFEKDCATCHQPPLFTDFSYRNNGLTLESDDLGRKRITQLKEDELKFRVPSLRNADLTYPYLHNGSYRNLYQVVDGYSNPPLSATHDEAIPKEGFQYSKEEKEAIIAFIHTLTDFEFIWRRDLSEPILGVNQNK